MIALLMTSLIPAQAGICSLSSHFVIPCVAQHEVVRPQTRDLVGSLKTPDLRRQHCMLQRVRGDEGLQIPACAGMSGGLG